MGHKPLGYPSSWIHFLNRKKEFLKGRTIISYSNSCIKELLKAASQAILLMIRLVWPDKLWGWQPRPSCGRTSHVCMSPSHPPKTAKRLRFAFLAGCGKLHKNWHPHAARVELTRAGGSFQTCAKLCPNSRLGMGGWERKFMSPVGDSSRRLPPTLLQSAVCPTQQVRCAHMLLRDKPCLHEPLPPSENCEEAPIRLSCWMREAAQEMASSCRTS